MGYTINIGDYVKSICYDKDTADDRFAPKVHTHDDAYYTKTSMDCTVGQINASIATVDGRVDTLEESVTAGLAGKSDDGHKHLIADITDFSEHNHDSRYSLSGHSHQATEITYSSSTVDAALTLLGQKVGNLETANWDISIVPELPSTQSAKIGKLYFLKDESEDGTATNAFDEYIWTGSKYEKIGQRTIDLSDYVTDVNLSFNDNTGDLTISLSKGVSAFTL